MADDETEQIVEALWQAGAASIDGIDRPKLDGIERRRQALLNSLEVVTFTDYGIEPNGKPVERSLSLREIAGHSRSRPWGEFLYRLVRAKMPDTVIEMGSCVGIAASYIGSALEANGTGRLVTIEGSKNIARHAQATIDELDLGARVDLVCGPFDKTLVPVLERARPVDLLFHDGQHFDWCYIRDFAIVLPYMQQNGVVVFDDIRWEGNRTLGAWKEMSAHPRVKAAVDCGHLGALILH